MGRPRPKSQAGTSGIPVAAAEWIGSSDSEKSEAGT
jgi:hypothetical protein